MLQQYTKNLWKVTILVFDVQTCNRKINFSLFEQAVSLKYPTIFHSLPFLRLLPIFRRKEEETGAERSNWAIRTVPFESCFPLGVNEIKCESRSRYHFEIMKSGAGYVGGVSRGKGLLMVADAGI